MLSDNIREYRKRNNMSQDELAEKLGVSRQSVSLWETGQTQPTIDNIIALAKIFNVSTDAILGNSVKEQKPAEDTQTKREGSKNIKLIVILAVAAVAVLCAVIITVLVIKNSNKNDLPANAETSDTQTDTESDSVTEAITAVTDALTETDEEIITNVETVTETISEITTVAETTEEIITDAETTEEITTAAETTEEITEEPETEKEMITVPETKEEVTTAAETTAEVTAAPETEKQQEPKKFDLYAYLKEFTLKNGETSGTYCSFYRPSTVYGGYENENFSVTYWSDYEKIEFCLHCPLDDTLSIAFYITMRGRQESKYEYSVSKYYRDTGVSMRLVKGYLDPSEFSASSPLKYDSYTGSTQGQDTFLEESRVGICDLIKLIKNFVTVEKLDCDFSVFGFKKF